jgi:hypothetical protein
MGKAKSDAPPFRMVVEKGPRLAPATASDAERLDTWRVGSQVSVQFVRNGSRVMERKWWAVLGLVIDQCNVPWKTKEQASEAVKLALGIVNLTKTVGGAWMQYPKSLTELTDPEIDEAVRDMMDLITKMTGIDPETLRKETADVGQDDTEQPEAPPSSSSGYGSSGDEPGSDTDSSAAVDQSASGGPEEDGSDADADEPSSDTRDPKFILNLKAEAVDKFLGVALDTKLVPDPKERRGILERTKNAWKSELPHHLDFLKACFETADKVIKGQMVPDKAREYLGGLVK